MADLVISDQIAQRLREIAQREQLPVEDVISRMIDTYAKSTAQSERLYDADERKILSKIYAEARAYWQHVGDTARLSLTDDELDEQFWCIDPDGIPRLNSDKDKIHLPPDPFVRMAEMAEEAGQGSERTDISEHFDEVMEEQFRKDWERRKKEEDAQ